MLPSTQWKETLVPNEAARLEQHAQTLNALQRKRAARQPVGRALHGKAHGGVEAELTVLPDLPEHARIGVFAAPATYRAYVRFSNGVAGSQADQKPDGRGIAIKVVGVEGKKIIPGMESARTQDFLALVGSFTPFANADEFLWFIQAVARPATLLPSALFTFGPVRAFTLLRALLSAKPALSLATASFNSCVPIQFGSYAVHFCLAPHAGDSPGATRSKSPNFLGEDLSARLAVGPVVYDFRVQFFVDEVRTPIENSSVEWKESDSPWITVARLVLPRQSTTSARGQKVAALVERMSFDPWHALEAHRPLGQLMRARNPAYRASTQERKATGEPDGSEALD